MFRRILLTLWLAVSAAGSYWLCQYAALPQEIFVLIRWAPLTLTALLVLLLALPEKAGEQLCDLSPIPVAAALQGGGALLLAFSGARQLMILRPSPPVFDVLTGVSLLLAGLGLLGGLKGCEGGERPKAAMLLLLTLPAALVQLLTSYWNNASDPVLQNYDMQAAFIGTAAVSAALLSDFAFASGKRRLTIFFLSLTVTLAGSAVSMTETLVQLYAVIGTAIAAFGFLLSLLFGFRQSPMVRYELVEDPFSTGRIRARETAECFELSEEDAPATPPAAPQEATVDTPPDIDSDIDMTGDFDLSRVDRLLLELGLDTDDLD